MSDAVDTVLSMVASGRLSAAEAGPLLDALEASVGEAPRVTDSGPADDPRGPRPPTTLRIEVREGSRQVVNLRLPLAIGRAALDRVPGLTGDHVDSIRDALRHGVRGPIVEVDAGDGDGVRIVLE